MLGQPRICSSSRAACCSGEDEEFAVKYLAARAKEAGVEVQLHPRESSRASVVTAVQSQHYRQLKAAVLAVFAPPQVGSA